MQDLFNKLFKEYSFVIELKNTTTLHQFQTICYNFEEIFKIKPNPMKNLIGLEPKQQLNLQDLINILTVYKIKFENFIILGDVFNNEEMNRDD